MNHYIFINGILTKPADIRGWTDRAEEWIQNNTNFQSTRYEYFSDAIFRQVFQDRRRDEVIEISKMYSGKDLILVGHSNGCDIISRVIKHSRLRFKEVHLFAAATDCSFNANGFNKALREHRIEHIFLYGSHKDSALAKAKKFSWLSAVGLGYGYLGLDGPSFIDQGSLPRITINWKDTYDHSTWFDAYHFNKTMKLIVSPTPQPEIV